MYQDFLTSLYDDYLVLAPDLPGHGESRWVGLIQDWNELAEYYIEKMTQNLPPAPMIGMGHSIGGILVMLMAIKRPGWFSKIILLDPVLLPKPILWVIRGLHLFSLSHLIPLARATKRRKQTFPSREAALDHYSKKAVFSRWEPQFLQAYVDTCLRSMENGQYQLSCAPRLESSIYQSIPLNTWNLPKQLSVPSLFIIGKYSDTVNRRGFLRLKSLKNHPVVENIDGGHLFPFERPEASMNVIKVFLSK